MKVKSDLALSFLIFMGMTPIICCTLISYNAHFEQNGCSGMIEVFGELITKGLTITFFTIYCSFQLYGIYRKSLIWFRTIIIIIAAFIASITFWVRDVRTDYFLTDPLLEAKSVEYEERILILRTNGTLTLIEEGAHWTCKYSGTYQIYNDTIKLIMDEQASTQFSSQYKIFNNGLLPLNTSKESNEDFQTLYFTP